MPRRLFNWTYHDVTDFLRKNGFFFSKELGGSHQAWIKLGENGEPDQKVEVNFSHRSYPPKTLKMMVHQSGIEKAKWIKWGES